MKVLIITNIPNPYRIPLFSLLNKKLESHGHRLKVVFAAKTYKRRKFNLDLNDCDFEFDILRSIKIKARGKEGYFFSYSGLLKSINQYQPDKIIVTGYSLATLELWLRSFFLPTKYLIWGGTIPTSLVARSFFRRLFRKMMVKRAEGCIAYGSKSKEYFVSLGADPAKIEIGINTVDTVFFTEEVKKYPKSSAYDVKHLLYVGYLTPRKNVHRLLDIIVKLTKLRQNFVLDIVGEGISITELKEYVKQNEIDKYVTFHGFKQKEELPRYYARSDCFLFQTDFDIWGLVLNEAMVSGLPCIASINAGATYDLVKDGVTGFAMDFSETERVTKKINWILGNQELSEKIGQSASRYIAENVNIKESAAGFVRAIENCV